MLNNHLKNESLDLSDIAIDIIDIGLIIMDEQGIIVAWNKWVGDKSGVDHEQAIGKTLPQIFNKDLNPRLKKAIQTCTQQGLSRVLSNALNTHLLPLYINHGKKLTRQELIHSINVKPIRQNQKRYCLLQITDVTSAYTRELALRKQSQLANEARIHAEHLSTIKSEFVSTVSHELRTPLTSICGAIGLIKGTLADDLPENAVDMLSIADSNAHRLLDLINDLLDIQRLESGKMQFHFDKQELYPIIEQSIDLLEGYANKFEVEYIFETAPIDCPVFVDPERIKQVITNLLSNAAKFSSPGEKVTVTMELGKDSVKVCVTDKGIGIPDNKLKDLFSPFTQVDSSDTRNIGGSGLGLAISKAIVENHQGSIEVESKIGSGSRFYFNLPIATMHID